MLDYKLSVESLNELQEQDLDFKIMYSLDRIAEWYRHYDGKTYVAFSGGKDSTVLLHLVRQIYPDTPAIFNNSGMEYPEIRQFVKETDNVTWLKPKMNFKQVIEKYGWPVISKHQADSIAQARRFKAAGNLEGFQRKLKPGPYSVNKRWQFLIDAPFKISGRCCEYLKKEPASTYVRATGRQGYLGFLGSESWMRRGLALRYGCNAYELKTPVSRPLFIWKEQDIWDYLNAFNVPYSPIYDMGYTRTGCMFCMFGLHMGRMHGEDKFEMMKETHPKYYSYCMNKLGCGEIIDYIIQRSGELPPTEKICNACKRTLPASTEFFAPRNNTRLGLQPLCRECFNKRRREKYYEKEAGV